MPTVTMKNVSTDDCLHHLSLRDGVRSPIRANIMLEIPTVEPVLKYHEIVAMT